MRHDEERDNTTATETQSIEADAHADTRETPADNRSPELRVARAWWKTLRARTDAKIAREHDEIVAKARQESEERNGRDDEPEDDGQPSEYEEWQDYFGGDDWDQGQFDDF